MRWIDAEWLKKEFPQNEDWDYPVNTNSYVVEAIDEAPSIEIIRCQECIYACELAKDHWVKNGHFCLQWKQICFDDGFCNKGESDD